MKRYARPLIVAMVAFGAGISIVIWMNSHLRMESFEEVDLSGLPTISYCEVKNNPARYSGKIVRVDASLHSFTHGYFLEDSACSQETDSSFLDSGRTSISIYGKRRVEVDEYLETFRRPNELWKPLRIVTVGRFLYKQPQRSSDSIEDRTPFHFEIFSIEKAFP